MIHGLYANNASFHSVEFTDGLNVVLAERTDKSSNKDTTNGLGKSTLIEIIDFCLGSSGIGLREIEEIKEWAFILELTVGKNRIKATRSIESPSKIEIEGPTKGWIEQPDKDEESGRLIFSLDTWKSLLGWAFFGLLPSKKTEKYNPSYRSLISYFTRQGPDAYEDPFRHFRVQKTWDVQLHVAFLLGLNWGYASRWQDLKDKDEALNAISKVVKTGVLSREWPSLGELETEYVQLDEIVKREEKSLSSFKVHPQYETLQNEADRITATIHELIDQNVTERRRLARYKESIEEDKSPSNLALEKLYEEAGIILPGSVLKTLSEAKIFHHKIIENRKTFLTVEVERLEKQIQQREDYIKDLTNSRADSLEVLRTHGALHEMTKLQALYFENQEHLERLRAKISELKNMASEKRTIKLAKVELERIAAQDHDERRKGWTNAVRFFNENSEALYKSPGRLIIDITETGYKYDVEIERGTSEGIGKMKIFCFDLMLLQSLAEQGDRINFLIHDSMLYDGVDSRQRALALERAELISQSLGGQYICTLNSDMVPRSDFSEGFDFDKHVRLTLTDREQSGSLLGIHFERRKN